MQYEDQKSRDLAEKPIGRLLWQYATPSLIAMSANSVYNLCDSMFLGKGAGSLALAGLAITFPLINISSAFGAMFGVGSSAQTSVAMGQNDRKRGLLIFGNMLRLDILVSICFTVIGLTFLEPILRLFGASDAMLPYAKDYMTVIIAGNIITHLFLSLCDQLRATGNPRLSMRTHLIVVILNIILDPLFIFGLNLGVQGAALATVISQICGLSYAIRFFFDKNAFAHFSKEGMKFDPKIARDIITIGLSPFLVNVCGFAITILINRSLMEQGGDEGDFCVGVYGLASRMNGLMVMMISGFSQGMQPIVGFNLGANKKERVYGVMKYAYACATCIMTAGFLLIFLFPAFVASWFTDDPVMIARCVPAFRIMLCALPLVGGQIITTTFFTATKQPKISIILSTTRQVVLLIPLLLILPPIMGVNGVWTAMPIAETGSALLAMFLLYRKVHSDSI